jgi:ribosomal protein S27AE
MDDEPRIVLQRDDDAPRVTLTDADPTCCPKCGAEKFIAGGSFGAGAMRKVCNRCGHEEG